MNFRFDIGEATAAVECYDKAIDRLAGSIRNVRRLWVGMQFKEWSGESRAAFDELMLTWLMDAAANLDRLKKRRNIVAAYALGHAHDLKRQCESCGKDCV
jgi:hypothetical protein